ncbi:uncharacterized protein LOC118511614 [Anopheles stephensi]|uniref:uncharacterized protein LOC118511614 n=1 Tax=Anopheles stephensi TaxID=30069 RepID=UPI0016589221|nr:uncharacterized protein LOC118511614 [Anopheles stephensi]
MCGVSQQLPRCAVMWMTNWSRLLQTFYKTMPGITRSAKYPEKAARKGDSLQELVDRVRTIEIEQQAEEIYNKKHNVQETSSVLAVSYGIPGSNRAEASKFGYRGRGYFPRSRGGYSRISGAVPSSFKPCWRCTSTSHQPDRCFAVDKFCHLCQTKGHIQRACTSSRVKRESVKDQNQSSAPKVRKIAAVSAAEQGEEGKIFQDDQANNNINTNTGNPFLTTDSNQISTPELSGSAAEVSECLPELHVTCSLDLCGIEGAGSVVCTVAGVEVKFLIDSEAEVNTVGDNIFDRLLRDPISHPIYELANGTDKPLRAYAISGPIPVIASFLAELFISPDRPSGIEKFYVIPGAKPLLGRSTATRYSVLQLGLGVRILSSHDAMYRSVLGEVNTLGTSDHFPKFKIPAVMLFYDKNLPPSRKVYTNIPPAYKTEVENRLQSLISSDIIEKVTNNMDKSFCSSLLVVPKGKRDIRLVVDLRGPNKCVIRTPFRMPTLEEILSKLNGAGWFSTIDITNAFYHIVLDESCRHLTNFFSGNDTYRFIRLPFGLCNAPDIFQEILQTVVLAECPGTVNYLDDILVFGHTKEEHDENLRYTLSRL